MAFDPLRTRRLDFVKSTNVGDASAMPKRPPGFNPIDWIEFAAQHAERLCFGPPKGAIYNVELSERPDVEKNLGSLRWVEPGKVFAIEKAMGRDSKLGLAIAGLGTALALVTGGASIPLTLAFAAAPILGGISDYTRYEHEMKHGATITPPTHFNRDALKGALGWGVGLRIGLTVAMIGLAAAGAPLFGLGAAWAAPAAVAGGLGAQILSVVTTIPPALTIGTLAIGGIFGAVRCSEQGYQRMNTEYLAAQKKSERPELGISVEREQGMTLPEFALNVIAPTVTASVLAGVGATQSARMQQHDPIALDPEQQARPIDWASEFNAKRNPKSFVQREEQRHPRQNQSAISFVDRLTGEPLSQSIPL